MPKPRDPTIQQDAACAPAEWPTWVLIVVVYATWLLAGLAWRALGPVPGTVAWVLATCWFMSLQHELMHGHPTRNPRINRALGLAPLAVWFPYDLYRRSHLAHHRDELLTEPGIDPESNYLSAAAFRRLPAWLRPLWRAQRTVLGRLILGPLMVIVPTWLDIVARPLRGDRSQCREWAVHLVLLAALLWAIERCTGMGAARYVATVATPALGVAMLRSFYEHRPARQAAHRVVVVEAGLFWRILYLNNNYHAVHHDRPHLPWYRVRRHYLAHRVDVLRRNGHFVVPGYLWLMRRHATTPIDSPVHPLPTEP